ncbi:MAG: N-formylglutamate amidohydrolase [Rhodobacteraceae bacterium]|nr:N-formylglutamate amidohydrolase [Paracoccaceae bacterium]
MLPKDYSLYLPESITTGVVFNSPHSGRDYPAEMLMASGLSPRQLRSSEDAFVDELFLPALRHGAPLLAASAPRAFVDLNRGANELDPALIEDVNTQGLNPRVSSGLGVIPRVVSEGRVIRQGKMGRAEAEARLQRYYHPYHAQLRELLDTSCNAFGQVLLIDCHSMPRDALANSRRVYGKTPEIILGDRFGSSCDPVIVDQVEAIFTLAGFRTARNMPFAGAFIAQNYGRPSSNQHVLQIEIDRSLYMNEAQVTKRADFHEIQARLIGVIGSICNLGRWPLQVAAE